MTHLEGIAHWLKYELDVDVLLTSDLVCALEKLRQAENGALQILNEAPPSSENDGAMNLPT
jgi:hypothetical protein